MDTTTPGDENIVDGGSTVQGVPVDSEGRAIESQPEQTTEAVVATETQDETPTPAPSTNDQPDAEQADSGESQADADDIEDWAKKKGLPLEDPVKLAKMYRDAEKRMHEATAKSKELNQAVMEQPLVEYTGNDYVDQLAAQVNQLTIQNRVETFFSANPEAREYETKMAEIVQQRPHLQQDLDALFALARNDPNREAELKKEGGRQALTNLAQKQQAVPPRAGASVPSNDPVAITPQNVFDLVDSHDQAWFEKNHKAISKAMQG